MTCAFSYVALFTIWSTVPDRTMSPGDTCVRRSPVPTLTMVRARPFRIPRHRRLTMTALLPRTGVLALALAAGPVACQTVDAAGGRAVRPGAPGEPSRVVDAEEARRSLIPRVTQADVRFMQGMIAHHAQAITLSALVPERAESEAVRLVAERIGRSQGDEIALMERWLAEHGQEIPDPALGYRLPSQAGGAAVMMPGMLTPGELGELEAASGAAFDRLFLIHMVRHHEGALTMVRELFESDGAGEEAVIFEFAVDVDSDQRIEIARMVRMLSGAQR